MNPRIMKILLMKNRFGIYLELIKAYQTILLLFTGIAGFVSSRCPYMNFGLFLGLILSLFLTISGSTILNMYIDRDIDVKMRRTKDRPLPSGRIKENDVLFVGLIISAIGLIIAFSLSFIYGIVVFSGIFIDVVVYTIWLKRKTPWSIIWGGISGGMPILAGRVLGIGSIDFIGVLFALSILLWIPTHIMTFSMVYINDYEKAGVPTFPSKYGFKNTRFIIALSSIGVVISIGIGFISLGMAIGYLRLLAVLSVGLMGISISSILNPSKIKNLGLFKYASLFMLASLIMVVFGV